MTDNIFDQTSTLFTEIVSDAISPRETRPEYPVYSNFEDGQGNFDRAAFDAAFEAYNNWTPSEEASAYQHSVKSVREVGIGDVVVIARNDKSRGEYRQKVQRHTSFSDLLLSYSKPGLGVVVAVSGRMFTVVDLSYGFWAYDHTTLEAGDLEARAQYGEKMTGTTNARTVMSTGLTYTELVARIAADERFATALRMQEECRAEQERFDAKRRAKEDADKAARAPFVAKAEALNEALSVRVAESKTWGTPMVEPRDLRYVGLWPLASLALEARLLKGEISQQQYDEALATLREVTGKEDQ